MEDFSQSRGDDDLFDDEIFPIEPSPQIEVVTTQVQEISLDTAPVAPRNYISGEASLQSSRGRGRGSSGRGAHKNGLLKSRFAPPAQPEAALVTEAAATSQGTTEAPANAIEDDSPSKTTSSPTPTAQPASKPAAVRGDRTGTGGVKKPKLTEEELNAKLLAAKERSQSLSAAHARAQADAASFEQRERVAQEKRAKEAVNRRVMDNEREKNRARKMAVMGGREWDAEKKEEDFRIPRGGRGRGRGSNQTKPINGTTMYDSRDPAMDDTRQYEWHEDRGRGRGRGRGGRGGRGDGWNNDRRPDLSAEADFPALPASTKPKDEAPVPTRPPPTRTESVVQLPPGEKGTWADQMASEAAKA